MQAFVLLVLAAIGCVNARLFKSPLNPDEKAEFNDRDWEISKMMGMMNSMEDNVVVSPISLKVVLATLLDAARGQTEKEIIDFLRLNNTNVQSIREHFSKLVETLNEETNSLTCSVQTRLFTRDSSTLNNNFKQILHDYYGTAVKEVDFNKLAGVVKEINMWASDSSKGHIKNLLSEGEISRDTAMLLINVIYFNGVWENTFDEKLSRTDQFFLDENTAINVKMMTGQQQLLHSQSYDDLIQIIQLPYVGGTHSMYFLLPSRKNGLNEAIESITPQRVYALMNTMTLKKVNITIPKFDFSYSIELRPMLESLGVTTIFSNNADFSDLENGTHDLFVSKILQKTGIDVNEKGSTAHAATVSEIHNKYGEDSALEFNANRPFVFFIREDKTRTVLFVGKLTKPREEATDSMPNHYTPMQNQYQPPTQNPPKQNQNQPPSQHPQNQYQTPTQNPTMQNQYQQSAQNPPMQNQYQPPTQHSPMQTQYQQSAQNPPMQNQYSPPTQNPQVNQQQAITRNTRGGNFQFP